MDQWLGVKELIWPVRELLSVRLACVSVTGAMRTCPTAATEVVLNLGYPTLNGRQKKIVCRCSL